MFKVSDAHHFRRMVAGVCMIAAPLLFLAAAIVSPRLDSDEGAQLAVVAENLDRWYISSLLYFASLVLFVPAVLGLMHMLRERETGLGHVGGGFALLGTLCAIGGTAIGFVVWQMVQGGADTAQMTALYERVNGTAGIFIPFYIGAFAITLGMLALSLGLLRAKVVHWSTALAISAGLVVFAVGYATFSVALLIVAAAFTFVGLGTVGRMLLIETDEEWEHQPEFRGFRPLAGSR